jgi:CubicO group peptidase (beta-lactamase class C family)
VKGGRNWVVMLNNFIVNRLFFTNIQYLKVNYQIFSNIFLNFKMKKILILLIFNTLYSFLLAQNLYFPPIIGNVWETKTPASLGWCDAKIPALYDFLSQNNTKGFIVLKDGKIVMEKYFSTFTQDSFWYWASAGKTLTSFTVGVAQQENLLKISDLSSKYLGKNWTSLTAAQEDKITVRHQLTMTTGLDDSGVTADCTLPSCLKFKADAGTRWAYHNAPYTLLDKVIESATGKTLNVYLNTKVKVKIGLAGTFIKSGENNVFYSTVRSMARFGLLLLNKGTWDKTAILTDTAYFRQMTNTSQTLNPSYGYLTWLNGKKSFIAPGAQTVYPIDLTPNAPKDMYSALGKNGQIINVIPSQNLVLIRMGNAPENAPVPIKFVNDMWAKLNDVICNSTQVFDNQLNRNIFSVFPNPTDGYLNIKGEGLEQLVLFNAQGLKVLEKTIPVCTDFQLDISFLPKGIYLLQVNRGGVEKVILE